MINLFFYWMVSTFSWPAHKDKAQNSVDSLWKEERMEEKINDSMISGWMEEDEQGFMR